MVDDGLWSAVFGSLLTGQFWFGLVVGFLACCFVLSRDGENKRRRDRELADQGAHERRMREMKNDDRAFLAAMQLPLRADETKDVP